MIAALLVAAQGLAFTEVSHAAGLDHVHGCAGPLVELCAMTGAVAVFDLEGDGWPDLLALGGAAGPDALFRNRGDGTFEEIGARAGVGRLHLGVGVAVGDANGDGFDDLFVTSWGDPLAPAPGRHLFYLNQRDGTFRECAVEVGLATTSPDLADGLGAAFGDIDLDGDLDLFVAAWRHLPWPSQGNRLFLNDGGGRFSDVTERAIHVPALTRGFAPAFVDMDGDRFPELLLAADFGTSRYYRNDGAGRFDDVTASAGVGLDANGMGSAIADLDADGRLDWVVTSVHDPLGMTPLVGDGNKLYWGLGAHQFREGAAAATVDRGGWGWGVVAADLDLDGRLDLASTNGFPEFGYEDDYTRVWLNRGGRSFREVAQHAGLIHRGDGRSLLDVDYDRDGDRDLVIAEHGGRLRLFENRSRYPNHHWLTVRLRTEQRTDLAPRGIGARVELTAGGQTQQRTIEAGCRYLATGEPLAHFGLGSAERVERLSVTWPDGSSSVSENLAVDGELVIVAR